MKSRAWLVLVLALVCCAAPTLAAGRGGAQDLITNMQTAVALIGRAVRAGAASPEAPAQKPFFGALKQTDTALLALATTYGSGGAPYFDALDDTGQAVGEVQATFALAGITDPVISSAVQKLAQNYGALRESFSPEALRQRQGGALSTSEAAQLQQLRQRNQQLQAELAILQRKLQDQGALSAQVAQLRQQSQDLASARPDLEGYLASLRQASDLEARMRGLEQYVRQNQPRQVSDFQAAAAGFTLGSFLTAATDAWRFRPSAWNYWNGYVPPNFNPTWNVQWNESWGNPEVYQQYIQQAYDQTWTEIYEGPGAASDVPPEGAVGPGPDPGVAPEDDPSWGTPGPDPEPVPQDGPSSGADAEPDGGEMNTWSEE